VQFASPRYFTVSAAKVAVRAGPSAGSDELGSLARGFVVCGVEQSGEWVRLKVVATADPEEDGGGSGKEAEAAAVLMGLRSLDPKKNPIDSTGAWCLARNKVKVMLALAEEAQDVETAKAKWVAQQQQQQQQSAAKPGPSSPRAHQPSPAQSPRAQTAGRSRASPTFSASPPPAAAAVAAAAASGGGDGVPFPKYFITASKCTVRSGPSAGDDELAVLDKGTALRAVEQSGDWVRLSGVPQVALAVGMGNIPDVCYDWPLGRPPVPEEKGPTQGKVCGMWALAKTSRGKEMLALQQGLEAVKLAKEAWASAAGLEASAVNGGGDDGGTDGDNVQDNGHDNGHAAGGAKDGARGGGSGSAADDEGGNAGNGGGAEEGADCSDGEYDEEAAMLAMMKATSLGRDFAGEKEEPPPPPSSSSAPGSVTSGHVARHSYNSPGSFSSQASSDGDLTGDQTWPQYFVVVSGPLHLHSKAGVGGTLLAELGNGEIVKAVGMEGPLWLQVELCQSDVGAGKGLKAFLSKSKTSSRSVVRADDTDAERQWEEQKLN